MLALDYTPITNGLTDIGLANAQLADDLSQVDMALDPDSGAVKIDEAQFQAVLERKVPSDRAKTLTRSVLDSTRGGMAVFGSTSDPDAGAAMPWRAMEGFAYRWQGVPDFLGQDLGITDARDAAEAAAQIRKRYPSIPDDVFAGNTAELLVRPPSPIVLPGAYGLDLSSMTVDERLRPAGLVPLPSPSLLDGATMGTMSVDFNQALATARCLVRGKWSGWWWGFTGWIPGWKVCLSHDCADGLANILMAGGGGVLFQAVRQAISEGISTVASWIATSAATVLMIIGYLFGLNIKQVNNSKGACLWGNWPYTGGLAFWATGR